MRMCNNPRSPILTRPNVDEGRLYWFQADCKLWSCPECAQKTKTRVAARAGRGAEYFAAIGYPVQFTTLTMNRYTRSRDGSIRIWRNAWPRLRKRMARRCDELHYGVFPEQHQDGTMHIHLLETSGLTERFFKDHSASVGAGYMAKTEAVENSGRAVAYVTKYMAKAISVTDWPKNFHRYRYSRQWPDVKDSEKSGEAWRIHLSIYSFQDECRYWIAQGYAIANTRRRDEVNKNEDIFNGV